MRCPRRRSCRSIQRSARAVKCDRLAMRRATVDAEVLEHERLDPRDRRRRLAEADGEHRHVGVARGERAVAAAADVVRAARGRRTPSRARPRRAPRRRSGCAAPPRRARGRRGSSSSSARSSSPRAARDQLAVLEEERDVDRRLAVERRRERARVVAVDHRRAVRGGHAARRRPRAARPARCASGRGRSRGRRRSARGTRPGRRPRRSSAAIAASARASASCAASGPSACEA